MEEVNDFLNKSSRMIKIVALQGKHGIGGYPGDDPGIVRLFWWSLFLNLIRVSPSELFLSYKPISFMESYKTEVSIGKAVAMPNDWYPVWNGFHWWTVITSWSLISHMLFQQI